MDPQLVQSFCAVVVAVSMALAAYFSWRKVRDSNHKRDD